MKWFRNKTNNNEETVKTYSDHAEEIALILKGNLIPSALEEKLSDYHESDIASALEILTKEERYRVYNKLTAELIAEILEYSEDFNTYLAEMSIRKQAEVLAESETSTAVSYLNEIDKIQRDSLLILLDDEIKEEILHVSEFDENAIGSVMSSNMIKIPEGITVPEAMTELINQAAENDNVSTLYVVNEQNVFVGAIDLNDLIIAREDTLLSTIITPSYPYVYDKEDIEDCAGRIRTYAEDSIPVLNEQNELTGVLTSKDISEIIEDYYDDDYAKFAGLTESEDLKEPVSKSMLKRLPWLVVLLVLGLLVSSVVGIFEDIAAALTIIVCFQSLVLDMAGNVGTQSLAVTIRVLMDERVERKDKVKLVFKEARIGALNGIILGAGAFLIIGLYVYLIKGLALASAFAVSACVGISLLIAMFTSSIIGTVMPIFFEKINIDPAVASGPFITTLNDLVAVVAFYGLAGWFLIGIMGM